MRRWAKKTYDCLMYIVYIIKGSKKPGRLTKKEKAEICCVKLSCCLSFLILFGLPICLYQLDKMKLITVDIFKGRLEFNKQSNIIPVFPK